MLFLLSHYLFYCATIKPKVSINVVVVVIILWYSETLDVNRLQEEMYLYCLPWFYGRVRVYLQFVPKVLCLSKHISCEADCSVFLLLALGGLGLTWEPGVEVLKPLLAYMCAFFSQIIFCLIKSHLRFYTRIKCTFYIVSATCH